MPIGLTSFPVEVDTQDNLVRAADRANSTLASDITNTDTTIALASASSFSSSGIVSIEDEIISYASISGNSLQGCLRGREGTIATSHATGTQASQQITAASNNAKNAAIVAIQNKLGKTGSTPVEGYVLRGNASGGSEWSVARQVLQGDTTYYVGYNIGDVVLTTATPSVVYSGKAVTLTIASPCVATSPSHGLDINDAVVFQTSDALPTGITAGITYYVVSSGLDTDVFSFSTSIGGAAVNTSGTQSGTHVISQPHGLNENAKLLLSCPPNRNLATMTIASPCVVTQTGHELLDGQPIQFATTGAFPTGIDGWSGTCTTVSGLRNFTATNHGLRSGDIVRFTCTGSYPIIGGVAMVSTDDYQVRVTTANTFQIYRNTSINGTALLVGTANTGTLTVTVRGRSKTYYVLPTSKTVDTFRFAATPGGTAINTSGTQSGYHFLDSVGNPPIGILEAKTYYAVNVTSTSFNISETSSGPTVGASGVKQLGRIICTTGNDSGTGKSNTRTDSLINPQVAFDKLATLDSNGFNATIQFADGAYPVGTGVTVKSMVGSGTIYVTGTTKMGNVTIGVESVVAGTYTGAFYSASVTSPVVFDGFRFRVAAAGLTSGIYFSDLSSSKVRNIWMDSGTNNNRSTFGWDAMLRCENSSITDIVAGVQIVSTAVSYPWAVRNLGTLRFLDMTAYWVGYPAVIVCLDLSQLGLSVSNGSTRNPIYGSAYFGQQYYVQKNAVASGFPTTTYFVGPTAGATATGGVY